MTKKRKGKKEIKPLVYGDFPSKKTQGKEDLMRLVRLCMKDGKLHKAYKIIQKAFLNMKSDGRWPKGVTSMDFFERAVDLASPLVDLYNSILYLHTSYSCYASYSLAVSISSFGEMSTLETCEYF